ncbi:MAG: serine/threonine protein kinase [Acidobacteria bacterium]|nr:serine/threonine protein kinase [Acidobacteriota bacterium]MBI3423211.1 serine/threonine protein kinase [Acidobacteriota bacterium]
MQLDWAKAKTILNAALQCDPSQRQAFLREACDADDALRAEVEKLLRAHANANPSFLENPVLADTASFVDELDKLPQQRFGPYRIVRELGRGGMGAVFLAERADGEFNKQVAIKVMQGGLSRAEVARFKQERQILADLDHPNIARLLDGGTQDGLPYVVMELVEGRSLRALLKEQGALPLAQAIALTQQVCAGLAAAHRLGVVHRDIKPENLMVIEGAGQPAVKILDFGIARASAAISELSQTKTGVVMGTAAYMSPEQALGVTHDQIDARSDIYSLGMVLYEMLTGQVAFTGASQQAVIVKRLQERPTPPNQLRVVPPIPRAVEAVVLKALEKERADRPQTVEELAQALTTASEAHPRPAWLNWKWAALLVVVCAALAFGYRGWPRGQTKIETTAPPANLPVAAAQRLTYRVFKRGPNGATQALGLEDAVRTDDEVYLEITPPFQCAVYLLYEDRQETLVWANPKPNRAPQIGLAGQLLRVPERAGVKLDAPPRKQNFLVVYVPDSVNWSLEDAVLPERFVVKTEDVFIPYALISVAAARRLRAHLLNTAEQLELTAPPVKAAYALELKPEARTLYHRVTVRQTE